VQAEAAVETATKAEEEMIDEETTVAMTVETAHLLRPPPTETALVPDLAIKIVVQEIDHDLDPLVVIAAEEPRFGFPFTSFLASNF
jgi:hypothetical protein